MLSEINLKKANELLEAIRFFNAKGWSPATSTNYSVRSEKPTEYLISRSGVDKSKFALADLILINPKGEVLPPFNAPGVRSSAETEIHTAIYQLFPQVACVLHTHSVLATTLSLRARAQGRIRFEGYEILKGLEGNTTHDLTYDLPVVPNSQEMKDILRGMEASFSKNIHGFLIAGHGLYAWGRDVAAAKRHIETFEFLFECLHARGEI